MVHVYGDDFDDDIKLELTNEQIADEQNIHFVKGWLFGFVFAILLDLTF
jgi:hypothetical protein